MDSIFDLDHLYRTYFKMALPSVFGLMVSVVYNLADTFFIAQSNDTALIAGVSLCAPVFTALMAFGNIYGQAAAHLFPACWDRTTVRAPAGSARSASMWP